MAEYTEADKEMLKETWEHMKVMNREMGEIAGELKWIRWIIVGTFLASGINLIVQFLGG